MCPPDSLSRSRAFPVRRGSLTAQAQQMLAPLRVEMRFAVVCYLGETRVQWELGLGTRLTFSG